MRIPNYWKFNNTFTWTSWNFNNIRTESFNLTEISTIPNLLKYQQYQTYWNFNNTLEPDLLKVSTRALRRSKLIQKIANFSHEQGQNLLYIRIKPILKFQSYWNFNNTETSTVRYDRNFNITWNFQQWIKTKYFEISTYHDSTYWNFNDTLGPKSFKFQQCISFALLQFPKPGDFVAFVHAAWRSRPLIGQVETVGKSKVHIRWWEGSYSTTWKPSKKRTGRQTVPWMEDIPKVDIVLTFLWKHKEGNSQDSQ